MLQVLCWLRLLFHAGDAEPDQAEAALLEGLETAVRVRHKSRQVAVAPSLPTWLLALPAGPASRVLPSPEDLGGRPDEMLPPIGNAIAHELQQAAASQPGAALLRTPQPGMGLPAGATAEELQQAAAGQPGAHLAAAEPVGTAAGPKRAEWVFMDPAKGQVLSQAECARQYPTLSQVGCLRLPACAAGGGPPHPAQPHLQLAGSSQGQPAGWRLPVMAAWPSSTMLVSAVHKDAPVRMCRRLSSMAGCRISTRLRDLRA